VPARLTWQLRSPSRQRQRLSSERSAHIPSLDGLRGIAALIVFCSHLGLDEFIPGGFGVTIFFFLSGYLITTLLRTEFEQTADVNLKNFYLRRLYRIFPPLYLVLAVLIILTELGVFPNLMSFQGVAAQLAQITNYYLLSVKPDESAHMVIHTGPMWSLAIEEHFYLIFPVALLFLLRRYTYQRIAAIFVATCLVVLLWRYVLVLVIGVSTDYIYSATDSRLDSLLFGCIMGMWWNPALDQGRVPVGKRGWTILLMLAAPLLMVGFLYRSPLFRDTWRYTLQGIALFPAFYCAVRYSEWPMFRWLESAPMRGLGKISYTFYLSQLPCIELVKRHCTYNPVVVAPLGLILALGFSTLVYFYCERPFAAVRRRLHT
jgi:peptidoglycan/LPS O-acetylase OafA/YrhL